MPEPGAAAVPQELLPPDAVWFGARPGLERRKIAPVLPHAEVPQGEQDVLMKEQAVRACLDGRRDPRAESHHRLEPGKGIDAHPQVDHDQVRILRKVYGLTVRPRRHSALLLASYPESARPPRPDFYSITENESKSTT